MSRQSETIESLTLLDDLEDHREAVLHSLERGRRRVMLFSHELDEKIFGEQDTIDAFSRLARFSPYTQIKILVQNSNTLVENHHPLLKLSRRLPSKISLHTLNMKHTDTHAFMLVDYQIIWLAHDEYKLNTESSGFVNFSAKTEVRQFETRFNTMWTNSQEDSQVRQLFI